MDRIRRLTRVAIMTFAACGVVVAWGVPPAVAQDPETVPPVSISPGDGAAAPSGTTVTFTVRTHPGDTGLWLHVSRSPQTDACGLIDADAELMQFAGTSDPAVYAAELTVSAFPGDGTFYWQAHRIHGGGCDVPGPIRSIVYGSPAVRDPKEVTIPPVSISPAPGARFATRKAVTFRVRSFAGDRNLELSVSRSPRKEADSCGNIGTDVAVVDFKPTSNPRIYTARVAADEFPRIGKFYWQANRGSASRQTDACVEGPTRMIVHGTLPPRLPGLYRGRTSQGRPVSFRLAASRTRISSMSTSIRLRCSRGTLISRFLGGGIDVGSDGFQQKRFSSNLLNWASVSGKWRSRTRVTGTVSSRAPFAGIVGRCGFDRVSWTARRVGG